MTDEGFLASLMLGAADTMYSESPDFYDEYNLTPEIISAILAHYVFREAQHD